MKGVTFIIILSVVWSIVSSIIEKRKAAAKKEAGRLDLSGQATVQSPVQTQQPVSVKVQSLRRRKKAVPAPVPVSKPSQGLKTIVSLHKEECPLPPRQAMRSRPRPSKQIAALLSNRRNMRTAIVLAEVLGKPVSQR